MTSQISGSYILTLQVNETFTTVIGALGPYAFDPGTYIYIGSAKRGIASRLARHIRLATEKSGKIHWHIDYLLVKKEVTLMEVVPYPDEDECTISQHFAAHPNVSTPVPGFGASDCKNKCPAHFFRIDESSTEISE
ncbi:MAG: GIY-YIG nuclease family protein [FCB group bacterium]|nr:GIY-YIG nuclease family protein [FCB group bacterium]